MAPIGRPWSLHLNLQIKRTHRGFLSGGARVDLINPASICTAWSCCAVPQPAAPPLNIWKKKKLSEQGRATRLGLTAPVAHSNTHPRHPVCHRVPPLQLFITPQHTRFFIISTFFAPIGAQSQLNIVYFYVFLFTVTICFYSWLHSDVVQLQ